MTRRIATFNADAGRLELWVSDCFTCGVIFAMTSEHEERLRESHATFYCPNGHTMWFKPGKSDEQKLKEAKVRETALQDQLTSAIHDAEATRVALLRDRERFANGVCPCCNRTFQNVLRHMKGEHPDYDITKVKQPSLTRFPCTCGRAFETLRGLRIHQGLARTEGWDAPDAGAWRAHLTKVSAR